MKDNTDIFNSYSRIRKLIGILGLLLPVLIVIFYGGFLPSISLFYYTRSAVFFIAILAAFGLFLISYEGYKPKEKEKGFSDNFVTHVSGFAILIVVLVPTACLETAFKVCNVCISGKFCLFGHDIKDINYVHLISAAIFFFAMGYMSIINFTRGNDEKYHFMYKFCGYVIWSSLLLLAIEFIIRLSGGEGYVTVYDVFILETVMIVAFAISWLLKGRTIEYIIELKNSSLKFLRLKKA